MAVDRGKNPPNWCVEADKTEFGDSLSKLGVNVDQMIAELGDGRNLGYTRQPGLGSPALITGPPNRQIGGASSSSGGDVVVRQYNDPSQIVGETIIEKARPMAPAMPNIQPVPMTVDLSPKVEIVAPSGVGRNTQPHIEDPSVLVSPL
jgi:hypothetical protein